ncbi:MAG: DUF4065 domain-containing protein [Clostridia bacterium]|nr:DUF4065 domain-containing protein [Clostridia bacterium]
MPLHTAQEVAAWLLVTHFGQMLKLRVEDDLTNMKLQSLLYYAQDASPGLTGKPLFQDALVARLGGPIAESVCRAYKEFGSKAINKLNGEYNVDAFTPEEIDLLKQVMEIFADYRASALLRMSHTERPWQEAWQHGNGTPLRQDTMRDFFQEHCIENGDNKTA